MGDNKQKNDRFKRIASKRVANIIKSIRSLSNCSNTNNYQYNEDDVNKMTFRFTKTYDEENVDKYHKAVVLQFLDILKHYGVDTNEHIHTTRPITDRS